MSFARIKRILVGEPLSAIEGTEELIPNWKALAVLASDALSSVAYATEEILIPLAALGAAALAWSLPIALAIAILLIIVTLSYRQTIDAYPGGSGAYLVVKENLGTVAGLVAGASLLIDYVLTVAVSVAAGVENIASALPTLSEHKVIIAFLVLVVLTVINLRGVRGLSASLFSVPTYAFIFSILVMLGLGAWRLSNGEHLQAAPMVRPFYPAIPLFILLSAFSHGCAALTGVEAISDSVDVFRVPQRKNARATLVWMALILGVLFLGITMLAHAYGIVPQEGQTSISVLAHEVFGEGWFYYVVQISTAGILFLAANTSYSDFPRLASSLARDRFLPRQLASVGDRLVFSYGVIWLGVGAAVMIFLHGGITHRLIPLYAVGVFLSFTLSQSGMVLHHLRKKGQGGNRGWLRSLMFNLIGAFTTFVVLLVITVTKFEQGAWIVFLLIPILVFWFQRINKHYLAVGSELSLVSALPPGKLEPVKHTAIVPVSGLHRGVIDALRYGMSISEDLRAVYVELDAEASERMQAEWQKWAPQIPFVVLKSPYRSVIAPLLEYIDDVEQATNDEMITVIIPEFVTAKWRHQFLHNQTAFLIRAALLFRRGKVVASVRYFLKDT